MFKKRSNLLTSILHQSIRTRFTLTMSYIFTKLLGESKRAAFSFLEITGRINSRGTVYARVIFRNTRR